MAKRFKPRWELLARRDVVAFLLFLAALIVGCLQLTPPKHFGAGYESIAIAWNLAQHGSFSNPFGALPTGPTAVNPPLYPLLLAALIKIFKSFPTVFRVAQLGCILANAATAALLPLVSLGLFGELVPGVAASALWLVAMPMIASWDISYTIAGLLLFCLLTGSSMEKDRHAVGFGLLGGVLAGGLFLLNNSSLLVMAPSLAFQGLRERRNARRVVKYSGVLVATFCIIGSAWAWRNYRQLGAFVLRTNLGMTLYASNNDCAESSLIKDEANNCYQYHHPNVNPVEAELLRSMGEVKYDRMRLGDAKNWIRENPRRFLELINHRFVEFWFPPVEESAVKTYAIWAATALSIPGLLLMAYRREPAFLFLVATLTIYPPLYYVVVSDVRYRYPVLWLSMLATGYAIGQLSKLFGDGRAT